MKILISALFNQPIVEKLRTTYDVIVLENDIQVSLSENELIKQLNDVDIFITEEDRVTKNVLDNSPKLKAIFSLHGTPVDIDLDTATESGIMVFKTPGRNADAVAELTIALMIMCARKILPSIKCVESGEWAHTPYDWSYFEYRGQELCGKTLGLVGFGSIGQKVAHRLSGFDMEMLTYDPYVNKDQANRLNVELTSLEDLLRRSDFVSVHLPVTPQTKGVIGKAEFALMKPTSYFINTARAWVVEEIDLVEVLSNNRIAGAGLDVYINEPIGLNYPLIGLDNVVLTPHIGGATHEVVDHHSEIVFDDIQILRKGKIPDHLVNPDCLSVFRKRFSDNIFKA
ncbi:MAG TPA: 2-hydroxyacid dehydrogenase [Desulfitobacteriaceae bacterium]|nr:2-hydroxyacid dehydrogenase [Desulfitobacteriaceae bacterium]